MKPVLKAKFLIAFLLATFLTKAQNKIYVAENGISCKETENGGCTIYNYCAYKYERDYVLVSYPTIKCCNEKGMPLVYTLSSTKPIKKYRWTTLKQTVKIKGFAKYNKLHFIEKIEPYFENLLAGLIANDSNLVWYKYMGGKPEKEMVNTETKVAKKWGFKIGYTGICGNEDDYPVLNAEANLKSQPVFNFLKNKYGENWLQKFNKEVAEEVAITNPQTEIKNEYLSETKDSIIIKGIVNNKETGEAFDGVYVGFKKQNIFTYTDGYGNFKLMIKDDKKIKFPIILEAKQMGFKKNEIKLKNIKELKNLKNIVLNIYLEPDITLWK